MAAIQMGDNLYKPTDYDTDNPFFKITRSLKKRELKHGYSLTPIHPLTESQILPLTKATILPILQLEMSRAPKLRVGVVVGIDFDPTTNRSTDFFHHKIQIATATDLTSDLDSLFTDIARQIDEHEVKMNLQVKELESCDLQLYNYDPKEEIFVDRTGTNTYTNEFGVTIDKVNWRYEFDMGVAYTCVDCGEIFVFPEDFGTHRKNKHGVVDKAERFGCPKCDKSYVFPADVTKHRRAKHPPGQSGPKIYKCPHCPKTFFWPGDLNKHENEVIEGKFPSHPIPYRFGGERN